MFLGDSGAYLFGSLVALNTIITNNLNSHISSFFFVFYCLIYFLKFSFHLLEKFIKKNHQYFQTISIYICFLLKKFLKFLELDKGNYMNSIIINSIFFILVIPSIYFADNSLICKYWFFSLILIYTLVYIRLYRLTKN